MNRKLKAHNLAWLATWFLGFAGMTQTVEAACGINWNIPANHFDGVNEWGQVSYWRQIGEVDCGENLKLPLIIGFKSAELESSVLGRGWILPLLESSVVQIDEKKFLLTQPDGTLRRFSRKKPTDGVLTGQGGWLGEIKADTINLWADCGWRLTFTKGKITSITTPTNRVITVEYANQKPSGLREGGNILLKVERDPSDNLVTGLSFDSTRIGIEIGDKPRVEVIENTNVLGAIEKSLRKLTFSDGRQVIYDFGVDKEFCPTLQITGTDLQDRTIVWEAASRRVIGDGEWIYTIQPDENRWLNAAIGRTNADGKKEFWHKNDKTGTEVVEDIHGIRTIRRWMTAGKAIGQTRKIETIVNGETVTVYRAAFDELGRLHRESAPKFGAGATREFFYEGHDLKKIEIKTPAGVYEFNVSKKDGEVSIDVKTSDWKQVYTFSEAPNPESLKGL